MNKSVEMKSMLGKQTGLSMLEIMFYLLVGGFILSCIFKLGPTYLNNYYVSSPFQ
jgi:hypothetical protein